VLLYLNTELQAPVYENVISVSTHRSSRWWC